MKFFYYFWTLCCIAISLLIIYGLFVDVDVMVDWNTANKRDTTFFLLVTIMFLYMVLALLAHAQMEIAKYKKLLYNIYNQNKYLNEIN